MKPRLVKDRSTPAPVPKPVRHYTIEDARRDLAAIQAAKEEEGRKLGLLLDRMPKEPIDIRYLMGA